MSMRVVLSIPESHISSPQINQKCVSPSHSTRVAPLKEQAFHTRQMVTPLEHLIKQGCPKNLWISSSTQLGEHPNFGLNAEEGFP